MLDIQNLRVSHGPIQAVHGISLTVGTGQCVALLGPNGAGKTSTLSAICGIAQATGTVALEGSDLAKVSVEDRIQRGIAISPEGRRIFSNLSVEANLRIGGGIRADRENVQADIEKWFDTFPILGERRNQPGGTLSGGEQQMLAIARALMSKPKILLLDEPSLGLAPRIVAQVFQMIAELRAQGMTILLVEQNARQALLISDYGYLLNNGRIQAEGTAADLGGSKDMMAKLTGWSEMDYAAQQIVNALSFGAEYALLALGLAIVFSVMGLVNFAHGEVIAVGGYTMVAFATLVTANPLIINVGAVAATALTSVALERVAFRPVRYADPTTGLLTAFGVSIVLQNLFLLFISPRPIAVTSLYFLDQPVMLLGVQISSLQIFETITTVVVIIGLVLFLQRTTLGLAMRAAALDFEMVRLSGIRANRVFALAFLISGLLAGLACIFIMARRGSVDPHFGFNPVLKAFVACVVGGFGSLPGAVLGGFLLGAVEVAMLVLLPQEYGGLKDAFVFGIIALVLVWRPDGILSPAKEKGDKA